MENFLTQSLGIHADVHTFALQTRDKTVKT